MLDDAVRYECLILTAHISSNFICVEVLYLSIFISGRYFSLNEMNDGVSRIGIWTERRHCNISA